MDHIIRIIRYAFRHKLRLGFAYVVTFGALVSYVILPKLFGDAIDKIAIPLGEGNQVPESEIAISVLIILMVSVVRGMMSYGQTFLSESLSQHVSFDLRNEFYNNVQHQSFAFHDKYHTGALMSRAITDVENIRMFINMGLVRAPYFTSLFFVVGGILIVMDWKLGLISASFMPIVMIYTSHVRLKMRAIWLKVQEMMAELSVTLQENFSGMRVVKAFASEDYEEAKFQEKSTLVADTYVQAEQLRASSTSFMLFTFLFSIGLILFFGGRSVINGTMTPGELAQFIFYLQILAMPVRMAAFLVNAYARAASGGERLFAIFDSESPVEEKDNAKDMPAVKGHVRFENVSLEYAGGKTVLNEINLEAHPGEVIAFLGPPGSGKSSLVNMLPRFYDPTEGNITIDGMNIDQFTLKSLREKIGMVQQDVFLFTASLKDNIAYGREDASEAEIEVAAKTALMHDHIQSLDDGYDTLVGERGSTLSGGQRQRMSIARALLINPPILILDDSTSSVDADTEDQIRTAMESVMENRTTFVIANRLSTVHRADRIIVLDQGKIVEEGTHKQLLQDDGLYKEIYELQLRPQEEIFREIDMKKDKVERGSL
jgi:ATP-binding cassette subfamily B multidrug efflux pump